MNERHEYEIKSFSKTLEFNPELPKTSFSTNLSSKTQSLSKFYIRIKEHIIEWPKQIHTQFHVLS